MDRFTVQKEFSGSKQEFLRDIDAVAAFISSNAPNSSSITMHADYKRYADAAKYLKELCQSSDEKMERFREQNQAQLAAAHWGLVPAATNANTYQKQADSLQKQIDTLRTLISSRQVALSEWILRNPPVISQVPSSTSGYTQVISPNTMRDQHIRNHNAETERLRTLLDQLERKMYNGR